MSYYWASCQLVLCPPELQIEALAEVPHPAPSGAGTKAYSPPPPTLFCFDLRQIGGMW